MTVESIANVDAITNQEPVDGIGITDFKQQLKIVSWAKNAFSEIKSARSHIERTWYLNLCFYYGKQNVVFRQTPNFVSGVGGTLYVPPAAYWRVRTVINRIKPIIRTELSKLNSQKPSAAVIPASSDDHDLFAAQAGEQIWESLYQSKKIAHVVRRATWWASLTGTGYIKTYWDADSVDEPSEQMGDIKFSPETPFHIFVPDFREEDLENQPYLIHAQLRNDDWVKLNYPNVKLNISGQGDAENEILDDVWLNIVGAQNTKSRKNVLCLECWVKPGQISMFPNGAMFIVIADTLVHFQEGWPYKHKKYPFAKIDNIPTGKYYAESVIGDLVPLQREYNRTRSQIVEAKNKMAKPQLLAEKGSVEPGKITTEPGLVIEYQPGFNPPQPIPLVDLPSYVITELDRIMQDFNDLSGQHEVSKGTVPSGVTAATAINYLQEQDDNLLSFYFNSLEEALEKTAYMTLCLVNQFWETPRIVKIVGQDGFFDTLTFKGSDIAGNTDIRIEAGSALPTSKAAKQAFIMDLMKLGFIDPVTGLQVMEMGGIAKVYEAIQVDIRQAQRENLKMQYASQEEMMMFEQAQMMKQVQAMEMGEGEEVDPNAANSGGISGALIVPVNSFDNHMIHIETHNKFRKGQAFENLSEANKALFEAHVQQHVYAAMTGKMGVDANEMIKMDADLPEEEESGAANQFGAVGTEQPQLSDEEQY